MYSLLGEYKSKCAIISIYQEKNSSQSFIRSLTDMREKYHLLNQLDLLLHWKKHKGLGLNQEI